MKQGYWQQAPAKQQHGVSHLRGAALDYKEDDQQEAEKPSDDQRRSNDMAPVARLASLTETIRPSHAEHRGAAVAALQIAKAGERPERKKLRIAVVTQVEHARESSRGVERLVPESVFALGRGEIGDAAGDGWVIRLTRRHEPEHRPSRLRGGARRRLEPLVRELVAVAALAPAAVGVLDADEPCDGASHRLRSRILADHG